MAVWINDWRILVLIYVLSSGVWGTLLKWASGRLDTLTTTFVSVCTASAVVISVTAGRLQWQSTSGVVAAAIGGALGGAATLALYAALRQAPASIVLPAASLYLVVVVLFSYVFLGETLTIRQGAGVACAIAAALLLAR